jgi:uncharacterized membrane protein (DUF2068 family)
MQSREVQRMRPVGVTIMTIVVWIEGIVELLAGVAFLVLAITVGHHIVVHGHTTTGHVIDAVGIIFSAPLIILGLLTLIFGIGLWTLRRWAFWGVIAIQGLTLLYNILQLVQHRISGLGIVTDIVIPAIIIIYFFADSRVRAAFHI